MAVKLYTVENGTLIIGEYNEESIHLLNFQFDGTILTITRKYIKDINGNNAIVFCEEANLLDQNGNPIVDPVQYINDIWSDAGDIDNEDLEQLILDHINDLANPHQTVTGGGGGDKHFVFTQIAPSTLWNINHALGKNPSVSCKDSAGTRVHGTVDYVDINNLTISFTYAFSGSAYLN